MTTDEDVGATQASFGGAWSRGTFRCGAAGLWLTTAIPPVMVAAEGMPWWAAVLVEAVLLVTVVPLGFALWYDAAEHREHTERLRRAGRPAVAEITDVAPVDTGDDNGTVVVLRLRISGDDVPPFTATYRGRPDPEYRVGGLLHALVDPADNLFTLRYR